MSVYVRNDATVVAVLGASGGADLPRGRQVVSSLPEHQGARETLLPLLRARPDQEP